MNCEDVGVAVSFPNVSLIVCFSSATGPKKFVRPVVLIVSYRPEA